jgi:hypothetical protein
LRPFQVEDHEQIRLARPLLLGRDGSAPRRPVRKEHDVTDGLSGIWHNQHGSELEISVAADGRLSGRFRSATGLPSVADESEVVGFVARDLVAFTVNFGNFDSLTAWTGHHVRGDDERIETLWHMCVILPVPDRSEDLWKGVWTGADVYRRGAAKAATERTHRPSHPLPGKS